LGLGGWGLGLGVWGMGPIPKSPIPNPQSPIPNVIFLNLNQVNKIYKIYNCLSIYILKKFKFIYSSFFGKRGILFVFSDFLSLTNLIDNIKVEEKKITVKEINIIKRVV